MAHQLTMEEREIISQMKFANQSQVDMARRLKRHPSTISRELQRNSTSYGYYAHGAQMRAQTRRSCRRICRKMEQKEVATFVQRGLKRYWSPDQIAGRCRIFRDDRRPQIGRQTIYNWIVRQEKAGNRWKSYLRLGHKRRRVRKEPPASVKPIGSRPVVVDRRRRYGDWEGDTVVGAKHRGALVTNVERKSGYLLASKVVDRKAYRVNRAIRRQFHGIPDALRKTITFDRGKEFSEHESLAETLQIDVYFADPYCSWQRGTNENTNGLVRQYFPKGTDFTQVASRDVARATHQLNDRPRKRLGYRTPREVLVKYLARCN